MSLRWWYLARPNSSNTIVPPPSTRTRVPGCTAPGTRRPIARDSAPGVPSRNWMYSATVSATTMPSGPTRADVLDVDIEARVDLEEFEVFPDEPEDLVGVAAQRRVAEVAVDGGEAGARQVGDVVVRVRDAPPGERVADGDAVAVLVVRDDLGVGDQQGRQEVRKLELDRREVIDRPHAHAEQVLGRRCSFLGRPGQAHRAGEADVLQAFAPDPGQGLQDDPHQDLAAEMRLVVAGIAGPPGRGPQRDGVAQGAAPLVLQRRYDLLRHGEQRVLLPVLV